MHKAPQVRVILRPAVEADAQGIADIYNHYVLRSTATYHETPVSVAERRDWIAGRDPQHPILVAQLGSSVIGWGCVSPFKARPAYRHSVEDSVYIHHDHLRQGVGTAMLTLLIEQAREAGHHTMIAVIDSEQQPSIALHEKLGFVTVGCLREVGWKFGRWLDTLYLQRRL